MKRSRADRLIGGVCSGIAKQAGIDPFLVRLAFILLAWFFGAAILAYITLWILVPLED